VNQSSGTFWNITQKQFEKFLLRLERFGSMISLELFLNDPEQCLKRIRLIEDEDDILSNPKQIQVYLPWL
jgi:hypothetical protein